MLEHKQAFIVCPWNGEETGIDEDIVELIQELWRLDIRTTSCCQDASRGKKPDRKVPWVDIEPDAFPSFAKVVAALTGVEWHITPRERRITGDNRPAKYQSVIGVCFPSEHYDRLLSYFKAEGEQQ